jgi:CDP-diglyceride synthetase
MCAGGGLLIALFFGAAAFLGFTDLRQQAPELSALVISVILAGTMVAWMRFRRMEWRPTLEMAGSSIAAGVLLIAGYRLDIVPESALVPGVCGLACVAMVAVMLFRVPLYSSSHTDHRRHAG